MSVCVCFALASDLLGPHCAYMMYQTVRNASTRTDMQDVLNAVEYACS